MKKFSSKRQAKETSYKKALKKKRDAIFGRILCQGCFCGSCRIMPSHRIARSRSFNLIDDIKNIDFMCLTCSNAVESLDWQQLENCEEIENYVRENDSELFAMYLEKRHAA